MKWRFVVSIAFVAATLLSAGALHADDVQSLRLVPFPKEVRMADGRCALDRSLTVTAPRDAAPVLDHAIRAEFQRTGLNLPRVGVASGTGITLRLAASDRVQFPIVPFRAAAGDEDYVLQVEPDGAQVTGHGAAGLFYGTQTLCQLIRANQRDKALPCLTIEDWPSLQWRAFQDDMTRNPSSTRAELEHEVSLGSFFKLNLFTYYMENQFAFAKHPDIGPQDGSLTPDDLRALVSYSRPLHIGILGDQQSFGHFYRILQLAPYRDLQETPGILCPVNEGSYKLLDDLYSEVIPLLPCRFFNVCCDETFGLGTGPSKSLVQQIGVGGVYARHIHRLHDLVHGKYGKRMMMWGDIILRHPENLKEIPKDVIMLTWGYSPAPSFEHQIVPFAESGYDFFVCPGVNNWSRLLPSFADATVNIRNFVRDGAKHGALGMLNTSWDDDGMTFNAPNWHGYAWGAECAWNASNTEPDDFNRRLGGVLFGEKSDHFGQAIALLTKAEQIPGMDQMHDSRFWQLDLGALPTTAADARASAEQVLADVRPAIAQLEECRREATANADLLDYFLFGARMMERIGQRTLERLDAADAYENACEQASAGDRDQARQALAKTEELLRRNLDAHRSLEKRYVDLWHRENRPYGLSFVTARFDKIAATYTALLDRLSEADKALANDKPLPSIEQIGLDVVELGARRTRPQQVVPTPLQPDAPWLDATATVRFGLEIAAGSADRNDLPVEVKVALPTDLLTKPVRAFRIAAGSQPEEVLAQLDPSPTPGHGHLTLLLPGPLTKGSCATVQVYLGLSAAGPRLAQAVSTNDAPKDMKWLENDKVRLLLGPEGAHLYRWEVKGLQNRDLTMPGDTGWFGFADAGGVYRSAQNKLTCTAHGPALVRYVCKDDNGLVKTISLFGGTSWAEVTLNVPLRFFWCYDVPTNFAGDGPTPGTYLFSTGASGDVGKQADGLEAQVKTANAYWSVKYLPYKLALGLVTPDTASTHVVGPGSGTGGVGIENGTAAAHFAIYGGTLDGDPGALMKSLQQTLDYRNQPQVSVYRLQTRPTHAG